jgi:dethiobiotin synthetase
MRSVFVTGTDTGVGKTVVAAAITALLRAEDVDAVPMKPVETGCPKQEGALVPRDLLFCLRMASLELMEEFESMSPYRFEPACSPHLAAKLAGVEISLDVIAASFAKLQAAHDCAVVEGAGGVMVPVGGGKTTLDVMKKVGAGVVLVAKPGLGTINHTLLSLKCLREAGLDVLGVVFCRTEPREPDCIEKDNVTTIEKMGSVRILGRVPFIEGLGELTGEEFCARMAPAISATLILK